MKKRIKKTSKKTDVGIHAIFLMTTKEELCNGRLFRFFRVLFLSYPVKVPLVIYFDEPLTKHEEKSISSFIEDTCDQPTAINCEITWKKQKINSIWFDTTLHFLELIAYKTDTYRNILLLETDIFFTSKKWFYTLSRESIRKKDSLIISSTFHTRRHLPLYNGVGIYRRTDKLIRFIKNNAIRLLDTPRNYDYALSVIAQENRFSGNYYDSKYILDISRVQSTAEHSHIEIKPKAVLVHTKGFFTIVCAVSGKTVGSLAETLGSISSKNLHFYEVIIYYKDDCRRELQEVLDKVSFKYTLRSCPDRRDMHKDLSEKIAMLECFNDVHTEFVLFVKPGFIFTEEHQIKNLQGERYRICFSVDDKMTGAGLSSREANAEEYLRENFYAFDIYYMDPAGLFLTTKSSLERVSSRFSETYKMNYSQYCFKRASKLGINIARNSRVKERTLSKISQKIEWMGYFCFNFTDCRESIFLDSSNIVISKQDSTRMADISGHLIKLSKGLKILENSIARNRKIYNSGTPGQDDIRNTDMEDHFRELTKGLKGLENSISRNKKTH